MGTVERMARGHVDCTTRGTRYFLSGKLEFLVWLEDPLAHLFWAGYQ